MNNFLFLCENENDLFKTFVANGLNPSRFGDVEDIIKYSEEGDIAFLLADSYPVATLNISRSFLDEAETKNLKLYIEYPKSIEGMEIMGVRSFNYERLFVADNYFKSLEKGTILIANDVTYLECKDAKNIHIAGVKIAGYDKLAFDAPKDVAPILFNIGENVLVATTCFSSFISGRFSPKESWKCFFEDIVCRLTGGAISPSLDFSLEVAPTYNKEDVLPSDCEIVSAGRSCDWFFKNALSVEELGLGVLEGYCSAIGYNGFQQKRSIMRCDCVMESSLVFALKNAFDGDPKAKEIFYELLDYGFSEDFFVGDKNAVNYGFLDWMRKGKNVYYGDDNARAILAALAARSVTGESKWDDKILKCILANLKVCDKNGFTISYHTPESLKRLADGEDINVDILPRPHYQCYIWAMFLWGYELTGYKKLLDMAKAGIKVTMDAFPDGWKWTNSLTAEIARMVLPLSFLVKIENTREHREWLKKITDALLENMVECGAIKDKFGDIKMGTYPPPQSNEDYGTTEASIIQSNADPATDLLYTTNWAFLGLHEAAMVTKDEELKKCEDKLAKFLVRIQISSETHPELDGAWLRSFDFEKWEPFGSSADTGWGVWCVETGWTNSWIASVLYLRELERPVMTSEAKENFLKIAPDIIKEMMN